MFLYLLTWITANKNQTCKSCFLIVSNALLLSRALKMVPLDCTRETPVDVPTIVDIFVFCSKHNRDMSLLHDMFKYQVL
jgi:hypothetical protein